MIYYQDFCRIAKEFGLYEEMGTYESYILPYKTSIFYLARYNMQICECSVAYNLVFSETDNAIIPTEIKEIDSVEELREGIKSFLQEQKEIKIKMKLNNIDEDFK